MFIISKKQNDWNSYSNFNTNQKGESLPQAAMPQKCAQTLHNLRNAIRGLYTENIFMYNT
jgi:hypothetical protein